MTLASDQTTTKHSVWMSMNVLRKMEAAGNTHASIIMEAIDVNVILVISLIQSKHTAVSRRVVLQKRNAYATMSKGIMGNRGVRLLE